MTNKSLNWKPDIPIAVPSDDHLIAIHDSDWQRLRRHATYIQPKVHNLSTCYSILFGVAASTGPSVIPIAISNDLPSWVTPLYLIVFLSSLFLAIVLVIVNGQLKRITTSQVEDLANDMKDIDSRLHRTSSPPHDPSTAPPPAGLALPGE